MNKEPAAVTAADVLPRGKKSNYPEPYFSRMAGREKKHLGNFFGLKNFGVNLTRLVANSESALLHRHSRQDEFIYILQGEPILVTEAGETRLKPGMCAGFPAGGIAHKLINRSDSDVVYLEVGDRSENDRVEYPEDDLQAVLGSDLKWKFTRKDGTPY